MELKSFFRKRSTKLKIGDKIEKTKKKSNIIIRKRRKKQKERNFILIEKNLNGGFI